MTGKTERIDLLHMANMMAQSKLSYDKNNAIALFNKEFERRLEASRTPGLTDKDRKRIEEEAYGAIPGSKEADEEWKLHFQNAKHEIFAKFS